jgi:hypothetical protein
MTGVGGRGGESARVIVVVTLVTFVSFLTDAAESEPLEDEESELESGDEDFFESVALESDPTFWGVFVPLLDADESLSKPELEESLLESGNGTFCAIELVEESESESEDESLLDELEPVAAFALLASLAESDEQSESDEESLVEELDAEDSAVALILAFFAFGASSSELESEPDDEVLLTEALRFILLTFNFGDNAFLDGTSLSSSASLEESLEDDEELLEDF